MRKEKEDLEESLKRSEKEGVSELIALFGERKPDVEEQRKQDWQGRLEIVNRWIAGHTHTLNVRGGEEIVQAKLQKVEGKSASDYRKEIERLQKEINDI